MITVLITYFLLTALFGAVLLCTGVAKWLRPSPTTEY